MQFVATHEPGGNVVQVTNGGLSQGCALTRLPEQKGGEQRPNFPATARASSRFCHVSASYRSLTSTSGNPETGIWIVLCKILAQQKVSAI